MPEVISTQYPPNGYIKIRFSREEVDAFNASWPCSNNNLQSRSYWFEFDPSGDLVDWDVPQQDDSDAADILAKEAWKFYEESL